MNNDYVKVVSVRKDGSIIEREYDNVTGTFYEDGVPVDMSFHIKDIGEDGKNEYTPSDEEREYFEKMDQEYKKDRFTTTTRSISKKRDIQEIKLQIGLGCNYNCSYCKQHMHIDDAALSDLSDVDEYIARFDEWCEVKKDQPMTVQLWGGEPLLYWKYVTKLVGFFRSRFDYLRMGFVTNGSLMTKEKADFLIENKVDIVISHDGPTHSLNRTGDPLKEGSESLKWINYYAKNSSRGVSFNAVISKQNMDLVDTITYIKDIMGVSTMVNFEGIVSVEDVDQFDNETLFTEDDYRVLRHNIKVGLISGDLLGSVGGFREKYNNLFRVWSDQTSEMKIESRNKCGMDGPYVIATNLKGDVLSCHSTGFVVGSVYDFDDIDLTRSTYTHWSDRRECPTCPVLNLCNGACMTTVDQGAWYHTCNNEFHYNMAIFEAAFEVVFQEVLISIEGSILRPEVPGISIPNFK